MFQCLTGNNSLPRLIYPIIKLVRLGNANLPHKSGKPLLYKPGQNISPSTGLYKEK